MIHCKQLDSPPPPPYSYGLPPPHPPRQDFDEFKSVLALLAEQTGKRYNVLQLKGMFRMADLDGSGSIDFNEFLHVCAE